MAATRQVPPPPPSEEHEEVCFSVIENFPNMVFAKDGSPDTSHDDKRGFRYVYFNAEMDHKSGLRRLDMIGQNALEHFNEKDAQQYFDDDRAVMALPPDDDKAVLDFYEPWLVPTGKHTLHTRKRNLSGRYMLGTFLLADDMHLGKVMERRRPILPPLTSPPSSPEPGFFAQVLEQLPVPVLVTKSASTGAVVFKNCAYRLTFAADVDEQLQAMVALVLPGQILERSNVALGGQEGRWHVAQRPIEDKGLVVYAIWLQGDEAKAQETV